MNKLFEKVIGYALFNDVSLNIAAHALLNIRSISSKEYNLVEAEGFELERHLLIIKDVLKRKYDT